jgi:hypothetical protein
MDNKYLGLIYLRKDRFYKEEGILWRLSFAWLGSGGVCREKRTFRSGLGGIRIRSEAGREKTYRDTPNREALRAILALLR